MPLPLAFANPRGGRGGGEKGLYSISEDDNEGSSDGGEDFDVLELLRNKATTSASSKNNTSSSRSSNNNTARSTKSDKSSNRSTTKSNPTRRKDNADDTITRSPEQQREYIPSSTHSTKQSISTTVDNNDNIIFELNKLNNSILEIQQKQQHDAKETHELDKSILQQVSTNKENVSTILQGIKQLQESIASIDTSKTLDVLSNNVENGLRVLANELETGNAEHREALSSLKSSTEKERKSLQAQINNERMVSSDHKRTYEKKIEMLRKQIDDFEVEKKELFIEKDKLARERQQLEKSEALFEQRKIAARDDIDNADKIMSSIREAEARLNDEMERLSTLSEYVKQKDAEAQEKLEYAEELSLRLEQMDTSIKHEAEIAEKQRQEISENRMNLARERVNLLKARSREGRGSDINSALVSCSSSRSYNELGLMQPYIRRAFVSLKNDLNKLRQE